MRSSLPNLDTPLLSRPSKEGSFYRRHGKRFFDATVAFLAIIALMPFGFILVVASLIVQGSPVLFRPVRTGRSEQPFIQYKLRTMRVGADRGERTTALNDHRITVLGQLFRKLSLDELPQLWNVLTGDMSLVGPRPDAPWQMELLTREQSRLRHSLRPGLTGLAQVSGRSALTAADRLRLDLEYVRDVNFRLDLTILIRTVSLVAKRSDAW